MNVLPRCVWLRVNFAYMVGERLSCIRLGMEKRPKTSIRRCHELKTAINHSASKKSLIDQLKSLKARDSVVIH